MYIVGAGLAGLIAAYKFPEAVVIEKGGQKESHRAVLRFRTDAISQITGINFKKVTVRKGIYHKGDFVEPNIQLANSYSKKVLGEVAGDRSIWNIESCTRFIAPHDFYEQLIRGLDGRIMWNQDFNFNNTARPVISTAPLPVTTKACGIALDEPFHAEPIYTYRYKLNDVRNVYQTIYNPDRDNRTSGIIKVEI